MTLRLLGISGSLRARSTNTRILEGFLAVAPPDVAIDILRGISDLPLFNPDIEGERHEAVEALGQAVAACDGIICAAPEYAHGIAGGLKNALDWLVSGFEIPGKPVMLVHGSTRSTTSREHLREVLKTMSCRVYDGTEFEVHLVGRDADTISAMLNESQIQDGMREALARFMQFIQSG